jgi:hypothetical protein
MMSRPDFRRARSDWAVVGTVEFFWALLRNGVAGWPRLCFIQVGGFVGRKPCIAFVFLFHLRDSFALRPQVIHIEYAIERPNESDIAVCFGHLSVLTLRGIVGRMQWNFVVATSAGGFHGMALKGFPFPIPEPGAFPLAGLGAAALLLLCRGLRWRRSG